MCLLSAPSIVAGNNGNAIQALLPRPVSVWWALNLGLGAVLLLWGLIRRQLHVRTSGLLLLAVSASIYTGVIVVYAGARAIFPAAITLAFALACYTRRVILLTVVNAGQRASATLDAVARSAGAAAGAVDAIISADSHGRIVTWNHGAEQMFGWSAGEIVGQPLTTIIPERLRAAHNAGLARVRDTGHSALAGRVVTLCGLPKSGDEFSVELSIGSWQAAEGVMFSAVIRDVSGRDQVDDKAKDEAKDEAKEADQREPSHPAVAEQPPDPGGSGDGR
jgi:PAS domain S-box-containing protein